MTDLAIQQSATVGISTPPSFRLRLALLASLLFHGGLLVSGSYQRTYDAYVHMFFADHYRRNWFSLFEPRWYTGFEVTAYPPGAHQAVAGLSHLIGLDWAYVAAQMAAILLLVVGVYRMARLWVDEEAAGFAALFVSVSTAVAQVVHVFGQLPTVLGLGFVLCAAQPIWRWLVSGRGSALAQALALLAAGAASHHVTILFGTPFLIGPVAIAALRDRLASGGSPRRLIPVLARGALLGTFLVIVTGLTILPYWLWASSDPVAQVPIPHASRANFLADLPAGFMFWLVPLGPLLFGLVYALVRSTQRGRWPLGVSALTLLMLGLGGTTPIARAVTGDAFDVLTFDRFTLWAVVVLSPVIGDSLRRLWVSGSADEPASPRKTGLWVMQGTVAVGFVVPLVLVAGLPRMISLQPDPIDMKPIVEFLQKDDHWQWRYLTLGFGDQLAHLGSLTEAANVEGDYHSVRRLPELTSSPVERLDGAKYFGQEAMGSLRSIVGDPARYGLKFVFSNDDFYDPLLFFNGWDWVGRLPNGIVIWQREGVAVPDPPAIPPIDWRAYWWGLAPGLAVLLGIGAVVAGGRLRARHIRTAPWSKLLPATHGLFDDLARYLRTHNREPMHRSDDVRNSWTGKMRLLFASSIAGGGILGIMFFGGTVQQSPPTRQAVAYLEDLASGNLEQAYLRLDPKTRPRFADFVLDRSQDFGLATTLIVSREFFVSRATVRGSKATVVLNVSGFDALSDRESQKTFDLVNREDAWYITPDPPVTPPQPPALVTRRIVEFPVPVVPAEATALIGSTPPGRLPVSGLRTVQSAGTTSIIGIVTNTDSVPIFLTFDLEAVTSGGRMRTAQTVVQHHLLPAESTPFRIDLEEPPEDELRLTVLGVPTIRGLERRLSVADVRITRDGLEGSLINGGDTDIVVAQLIWALTGPNDELIWVADQFHSDGLSPAEAGVVDLAVVPPEDLRLDPIALQVANPEGEVTALSWFELDQGQLAFIVRGMESE